jgi:hypothetical protein
MANFTFNSTASMSTSDGITLDSTVTNQGANGKQLLDDTFVASTTVDFAPLVATITDPLYALLVCSGDGATLNFDGLGASAKAYRVAQLGLVENSVGPSGVLDLAIVTQGAEQRVRFLCVGDPD